MKETIKITQSDLALLILSNFEIYDPFMLLKQLPAGCIGWEIDISAWVVTWRSEGYRVALSRADISPERAIQLAWLEHFTGRFYEVIEDGS